MVFLFYCPTRSVCRIVSLWDQDEDMLAQHHTLNIRVSMKLTGIRELYICSGYRYTFTSVSAFVYSGGSLEKLKS